MAKDKAEELRHAEMYLEILRNSSEARTPHDPAMSDGEVATALSEQQALVDRLRAEA